MWGLSNNPAARAHTQPPLSASLPLSPPLARCRAGASGGCGWYPTSLPTLPRLEAEGVVTGTRAVAVGAVAAAERGVHTDGPVSSSTCSSTCSSARARGDLPAPVAGLSTRTRATQRATPTPPPIEVQGGSGRGRGGPGSRRKRGPFLLKRRRRGQGWHPHPHPHPRTAQQAQCTAAAQTARKARITSTLARTRIRRCRCWCRRRGWGRTRVTAKPPLSCRQCRGRVVLRAPKRRNAARCREAGINPFPATPQEHDHCPGGLPLPIHSNGSPPLASTG
mmetsp:Transcript_14736/g.32539  ORF Transcript_14736/g.32539 Transcript_14736/m.32539 type:complete len:278 (+) Transcript_14736:1735-2568(+)